MNVRPPEPGDLEAVLERPDRAADARYGGRPGLDRRATSRRVGRARPRARRVDARARRPRSPATPASTARRRARSAPTATSIPTLRRRGDRHGDPPARRGARARARSSACMRSATTCTATRPARALLRGDAATRSCAAFLRMAIELEEPPPAPRVPEGLRSAATGAGRGAVHAARRRRRSPTTGSTSRRDTRRGRRRPRRLRPHALVGRHGRRRDRRRARQRRQAQSATGWIDVLATRRPMARRGIAQALLHASFGEFFRRGERTVGARRRREQPDRRGARLRAGRDAHASGAPTSTRRTCNVPHESRLRARCPDCRTLTAVAIGPDYQCHVCGREFAAGLVRVPRAWGAGGERDGGRCVDCRSRIRRRPSSKRTRSASRRSPSRADCPSGRSSSAAAAAPTSAPSRGSRAGRSASPSSGSTRTAT